MSFRNILTFVMLIFFVAFAFPAFACPISIPGTDVSFQQMPPPGINLVNMNKDMTQCAAWHSTNHKKLQNISNIDPLAAIMPRSPEVLHLAYSRSEWPDI